VAFVEASLPAQCWGTGAVHCAKGQYRGAVHPLTRGQHIQGQPVGAEEKRAVPSGSTEGRYRRVHPGQASTAAGDAHVQGRRDADKYPQTFSPYCAVPSSVSPRRALPPRARFRKKQGSFWNTYYGHSRYAPKSFPGQHEFHAPNSHRHHQSHLAQRPEASPEASVGDSC
jgi:hypothetical protein